MIPHCRLTRPEQPSMVGAAVRGGVGSSAGLASQEEGDQRYLIGVVSCEPYQLVESLCGEQLSSELYQLVASRCG